ncbi:MAG: type II secretion system F family protein [Ramlibacter sp.]|nr:type II secretion system F family protein [Cryobacterium sp.]
MEQVAQVTQRLAVLLAAGVSPASAWEYLDRPGADGGTEGAPATRTGSGAGPAGLAQPVPIIRAAAAAGRRGDSIADAVAAEARILGGPVGEAWLGLAAAWQVATQAGAPLAACLRQLAASFRELGQLHTDLQVALAGPAATARMVAFLPGVGVLLGSLLGFDTLHTLFLTVPGWVCLAGGATLMLAADRWNRRLVRSARARDQTPGLELELTALAMTGGGSIDRARALVEVAAERFALRRGQSAAAIEQVLALSQRAGVPAAELLRSEAEQLRRDARSDGQRRAATLAVTLMIPLGVCVLPAFMLIGVVPLLVTVLSSTVLVF